MQEYNICYSLDSEYTEQLAASIVSILKNSDEKENINFYILDGGLSKKDKTAIETLKKFKKFNIKYIQVNKKDFTSCPLLKEKGEEHKDYHVTLPTYFRFKIPEFFHDIDKILYLDCDVIVRSSLKSLFETNIDNMAAAMVPDAESDKEALRLGLKTYFNAGVILININYWRENNIEEKLFSYAVNNKDKILWQDQDILNAVLQDDIVSLDKIWNFQYFLYEKINPAFLSKCNILHLAGRFKPWLLPFEHIIYDIYYYYLSFTFRKNKIAEYRQKASGKYLKDNIGGSVTNILLNATNEDIQGIYNEISKNYDFTKDQINILDTNTDNKINKIYDEISKNYEYTNEIRDSLTEDIKEHAVSLEQMFSQNLQNSINSTDSKITEVYNEITKNYEYTNEIRDSLTEDIKEHAVSLEQMFSQNLQNSINSTDSKITEVYNEITKNYEYTNEIRDSLTQNIKEHAVSLEQMFSQNFQNSISSTDSKITEVYNEITKNYDFTKESIEKSEESLKTLTDEKISKVYDEISKNYEYTNDIWDNLNKNIENKVFNLEQSFNKNFENNINLTEEKITKILDEISLNHNNTIQNIENTKNSIIKETDEKINKAYNYINNLNEEKNKKFVSIEENINNHRNEINNIFEQITLNSAKTKDLENNIKQESININTLTDEKISKVYDEITKNYKYTEYLVLESEEKSNQKIENIKNSANENISSAKNELYTYIDQTKKDIESEKERQLNEINTAFNKKLSEQNEQAERSSNLKLKEIYSHTNNRTSKLYKDIKDWNIALENSFNQKVNSLWQYSENNTNEINIIKDKLNYKADENTLNNIQQNIRDLISDLDIQYQQNLNNLKNDFDEKINQQRIKYENKLINMENIISQLEKEVAESKKNIFVKFMDRYKSVKRDKK